MGDRNTTAGQTNKAGPSDGTLTPDKVFVAVPTTDSKAQTSIAMDGFELGRRSSTQRFTQCSESGAPPQEQSCDDRLLEKRPFGLFTAQVVKTVEEALGTQPRDSARSIGSVW